MNLETAFAVFGNIVLLYFAYGTYRIDKRLEGMAASQTRQEAHLAAIRKALFELTKPEGEESGRSCE